MNNQTLTPAGKTIVGVQFLFVAFGSTVLVPLLIGLDRRINDKKRVDSFFLFIFVPLLLQFSAYAGKGQQTIRGGVRRGKGETCLAQILRRQGSRQREYSVCGGLRRMGPSD